MSIIIILFRFGHNSTDYFVDYLTEKEYNRSVITFIRLINTTYEDAERAAKEIKRVHQNGIIYYIYRITFYYFCYS